MSDPAERDRLTAAMVAPALHLLGVIDFFAGQPSESLNPTVRCLREIRPLIAAASAPAIHEDESTDPQIDEIVSRLLAASDKITAKLKQPLWLPLRSEIASLRDLLSEIAEMLKSSAHRTDAR